MRSNRVPTGIPMRLRSGPHVAGSRCSYSMNASSMLLTTRSSSFLPRASLLVHCSANASHSRSHRSSVDVLCSLSCVLSNEHVSCHHHPCRGLVRNSIRNQELFAWFLCHRSQCRV